MADYPSEDDSDSTARRGRWLLAASAVAVLVALAALAFVLDRAAGPTDRAAHAAPAPRQLVEEFLRKYANDPSSLNVQEVRYGPHAAEDGRAFRYVFVAYRERNQFGALVYREQLLRVGDDGRVSGGPEERAVLPGLRTGDWPTRPDGP